MAFIPTPNCVRSSLVGVVSSQLAVNTLWFQGLGPADASALSDLNDALIDWYTGSILPLLSNGFALDAVNSIAQDTSFAPSVSTTGGLPAVGAVNSATQAPQVAGVVSFRTPNRGRSARGRIYLPGVPENALDTPGTMNSTFRAAVVSAFDALNGVVGALNYSHVVVSHFTNHLPRTAGFPQPVITYLMDAPLDTQRRRTVGRGA